MTQPSSPDFMSALEQLNAEVGIPLDELLATVEQALAVAYVRAFEPKGRIAVRLDRDTAEITVESREQGEDGVEVMRTLPADDFRRLAAQTAKAAVVRHIRDLERERAMQEVTEKHGELATGIIDRIERGVAYIDLGRAEGVMPPEEQIPGEELLPNRPLQVVILDPDRRSYGRQAQVRVSRASKLFVHKLLEAEVPEVASGVVEIKAIAREPGRRSKVAVHSTQSGVDPVGACLGPKSVRHQSILSEIHGERVDIVPWSDIPARFVAAALGPATVVGVEIDPDTHTARVLVPRDQLSLAIGKDGQNARLAAKLTTWRIDIHAAEDAAGDAQSTPTQDSS